MTTSNAVPFSPIVRIYPGGEPADADTWGVGYDISTKVRYPGSDGGQPITYRGGRPDEAATVDPGEMSLTLDNRAGEFSTENPLGTYYPLLRRGTPITLSMVTGEDTFSTAAGSGWPTSSSGLAWSRSGVDADWTVAGGVGTRTFGAANTQGFARMVGAAARDVDVTVVVAVPNVATGAALAVGPMLRYTDSSNYYSCRLEFNSTGTLTVKIRRHSTAAGDADIAEINPIPSSSYSAGQRWRVRAQASGSTIRLKYWLESGSQPDAWSLSVEDTANQGVECGLYFLRANGNTNAVGPHFNVDNFAAEAYEFTGSVIKWPVRWDKSGNNCWAPITAAGPLRRLRQGTGTLKSPLARQLPAYGPTGYWPLEDGPQATQFASAVTGVAAAARSGVFVSPASDTSLAGATQSPTFTNATASIRGYTPKRQTGTGFAFMFLVKLQALPAAKTKVASFKGSGRVVTWNIYIDQLANLTTEGIETDGTILINDSTGLGADPLGWIAHQIEAEWVAGTVTWAHIWHQVGDTDFLAHSSTFASTATPRVYWWQLGGGLSDLSGAAWSHVWIGENTLPFVGDTFMLVSDGYRGELASDRITRLSMEEGVSVVVEPGTSAALGAQPRNNFLDAIDSAADADYGIRYEAGNGLGFRPLSARYNQDVTFALSVAAGEIDEPPEPVLDDQRVRNDWTVARTDGSSAQVVDEVHIAAEARYEDSSTINVQTDDVLADHAGWRLYLGTRKGWRWPGIQLNFARNPTLIPTWRGRPFAPRMTVTSGLDQVGDADPDVIVEGYDCTLWPHGWTADLACSDAKPWDQLTLDGGLRLDAETDTDGTATTTVNEALDTTETGIDVVTETGLPVWAATAEINGTVITTGGEEMTVSATTGAGSSQTLTAARSANGIVKSHVTGGGVYLAQPTYLSL